MHVHIGTLKHRALEVGDIVELRVDGARRARLRANHSATHLLHEALRRRLGEHVTQKGSLVAPDRLRFDISHPRPVAAEELRAVEAMVNARILRNAEVTTRLMTPERAIEAGALALFGEKYGDEVRVVSMGGPAGDTNGREDVPGNRYFSTELCGGTHVRRTGDIGAFHIVAESAVSSGVRRIEAVTGIDALAWLARQEALLREAAEALRAAPAEVPARVAQLVEERRRLERELAEARRKLATAGPAAGGNGAGAIAREVAGVKFAARALADVPPRELKSMADELKRQIGSGVVALADSFDGKGSLVVAVTDDLVDRFSAVELVRVGVARLGGKGGGGRPDMAQGGGPDASAGEAALAAIEAAIAGWQPARRSP
jgi:alanyl-tRNA synthetase